MSSVATEQQQQRQCSDDAGRRSVSMDEQELLKMIEAANQELAQDSRAVSFQGSLASSPTGSNALSPVSTGDSAASEEGKTTGGASTLVNSTASTTCNDANYEHNHVRSWVDALSSWEQFIKKKPRKVADMVYQGIPKELRCMAWQRLAQQHSILSNTLPQAIQHADFSQEPDYAELLILDSPHEKFIRRDIARTFPAHDFFRDKEGVGQEVLFNVIKAFSLYDTQVGYCQGSPFIVGILLMHMPEEEAFRMLVHLMRDYKLRNMFKPSMADLPLRLYQLDRLMAQFYPDLHGQFTELGLNTSMFASQWFLTLFASSLPLDLVFRIFDVFLLEGIPVVFRASLAIIGLLHNELLRSNFDGSMNLLTKSLEQTLEGRTDAFVTAMAAISINNKQLSKLEKEYQQMQADAAAEEKEVNVLRRQCEQLKQEKEELQQKVAALDAENRDLAHRLLRTSVDLNEHQEQVDTLRQQVDRLVSSSSVAPSESECPSDGSENEVFDA